jgi:hypothetical protein
MEDSRCWEADIVQTGPETDRPFTERNVHNRAHNS